MALVIAGAVIGVFGVLGTLLLILGQADNHYVTRKEYEATLDSINANLSNLKDDVRELRERA